jgi:hypothetical protein
MKQYYGYAADSDMRKWDFFKEIFKTQTQENTRIDIRYCSFCHKKDMINIIGAIEFNKNWVRERVGKTKNEFDIQFSDKQPNCIIVYCKNEEFKNQILKVISINKENL